MKNIELSDEVSIYGYHGTDRDCCEGIEREGFKIQKNSEHWITDGVYFFLDYSHAKWWTEQSHDKFGNTIKNPTVIKALVLANSFHVCDTRTYDDYQNLCEWYGEFRDYVQDKLVKGTKLPELNSAFFRWIQLSHGIKVFIIGFDKTMRKVVFKEVHDFYYKCHKKTPYQFRIPYVEYQMCVCDTDLITIEGKMSDEAC